MDLVSQRALHGCCHRRVTARLSEPRVVCPFWGGGGSPWLLQTRQGRLGHRPRPHLRLHPHYFPSAPTPTPNSLEHNLATQKRRVCVTWHLFEVSISERLRVQSLGAQIREHQQSVFLGFILLAEPAFGVPQYRWLGVCAACLRQWVPAAGEVGSSVREQGWTANRPCSLCPRAARGCRLPHPPTSVRPLPHKYFLENLAVNSVPVFSDPCAAGEEEEEAEFQGGRCDR